MTRTPAKIMFGVLASLSLYSCGQHPAPLQTDPYANGADYPWTYTRPDPQLGSQALTPGENTLFYEPILSATNGWGPLEVNRSNGEQGANDGRTITLNGVTYRKGLGVHANSDVRYSLKGTGASCVRFTADIGVDDEVGSRGSVVFQVYLDGVKAYDSGLMTGSSATKRPSLALTGKQELRLVVTDGGNGKDFDHADWANPKISCVASATGPSGSFDPGFGMAGQVPVGGVDSVIEPGDSVVVLGSDFSLKRLSSSGTVSGVGTLVLPVGAQAMALARQSNGNLVAVGTANDQVVVARFLPNLQPDPDFGTGGVVRVQYGVAVGSLAATSGGRDVAVQMDGKIVIVGEASQPYEISDGDVTSTDDYLIARLSVNGQPDAGFGTSGAVVISGNALYNTDSTDQPDALTALALQGDGKIVATGASNVIGAYRGYAFRFLPNGSLDVTFSNDGIAAVSLIDGGGYGHLPRALVVERDGRFMIGGATDRFQTHAFVSRLGTDGSNVAYARFQLAESFVDQGTIYSLAAHPDGEIVFGGRTPSGSIVGRLTSTLALDPAFGPTGSGTVLIGQPGAAERFPTVFSVQTDALGRIVATASSLNSPSQPSKTVRLLP